MKLQFNNKGLLLLQQQLYKQRDEVLKMQAEQIEYDINSWLINTFELSAAQLDFFKSIDQHLRLLLSLDISFTIENRLPIRLRFYSPAKQTFGEVTKAKPIASYLNGVLYLHIKINNANNLKKNTTTKILLS